MSTSDAHPVPARPESAETPEGKAAVDQLLQRLQSLGVRLSVEQDRLRFNAPKGVIDEALKATLVLHKPALMARLRQSGQAEASRASVAEDVHVARGGALPLSHTQQRLWFLKQMDPGNMAYQVPCALRMSGVLDEPALRRSLAGLVQRHESLRTRFNAVDGMPCCVIEPDADLVVQPFELSALPDTQRDAALQQTLRQLIYQPFEITQAPLMRVGLIRLSTRSHVLCLVLDHIVCDGISIGILLSELRALYTQDVGGAPARLAPLEMQYVDIVEAERRAFEHGALTPAVEFWKRQLAGMPSALQLPTDRPRPPVQTYRGARLIRPLPAALVEEARVLARREGATLFMVLLAAFQVLLHRYSGVDDIPVGTAVANRDHAAAAGVVGFFANNIVLRSDLSGKPSVRELLARVRETCLQGTAHQEMPFDMLVEALGTRREIDHAPLFQFMFVLQSVAMQRLDMPQLECEGLEFDSDTARFDLSVDVFEMANGTRMCFEFNTDLFDRTTVERMMGHYRHLLEGFVAGPDSCIDELPMLAAGEQQRLLREWNATAAPWPREQTLHGLFESQASRTPWAEALVFESTVIDYATLNARANQLAHHLRSLGVGRESLVGVWMERSPEMVVALLAVLKAGGAYVPLDPAFPQDRIDFMMKDAELGVVLTQAHLAEMLAKAQTQAPGAAAGEDGPRAVCVDRDAALFARHSTDNPAPQAEAGNLAYVIYTSGSTGRPKGVMLEHRSVVNFLLSMQREPGITAADRFVSVTTSSFDIAGLEIHGPLTAGGCVVLASRATALDGARLAALLEASGATLLQATPATWRVLIESGWNGKSGLKMLCGGESLPRDLAQSLLGLGAELWNLYGPTETTIWSTLSRVTDAQRAISIGRPIANTQVYVLEPSGLPAPIGVAGELCIGGGGLARGYRKRDELTAEKFVVVELPGLAPQRVYRTGDLVRWLEDGRLEFIGRRDHQVKVRGYRIELGEIESVLATHPGLKDSVVHVREDTQGDQRLVAYVVPASGVALDSEAARTTLRAKLPEYMIPNQFVEIEALPLTPNGKIDRKALPVPQAPASDDAAVSLALMTPTQREVAALWCEVLRVESVRQDANFFDIGGHSLLLVKLQAALQRRFARELPLVELFQHTTVAAQAERLATTVAPNATLQRARERAARQVNS